MMEKVLSFIIPAYNSMAFLDKCVTSFLHEAVMDQLEIIIVNDGSTDETEAIAEKYRAMYPGTVRVISQENRGHGGALNAGCAAATGKYLKAVDADDWVVTENLPEFVAFLRECGSDVVLTHYYMRDVTTGKADHWKSYPETFGRSYSLDEIVGQWKSFDRVLTFHGITYRRDFYRQYGIRLSEKVFYEDNEYATIPCCYAKTITPLDLFVYDYRVGDVQQSVSDESQLRRLGHTQTVLERLRAEYGALGPDIGEAGREYCRRKTQGVLQNYYITTLLVEPDRKLGRTQADRMAEYFRREMPGVYELSGKQYSVFRVMNLLGMNKRVWESIKNSRIYNTLRHNHDFN